MALSVIKYSSVNAKTKALFGKLLTRNDYEELLGKRTVQDVAGWLKKHEGYGNLLSEVNESLVHRGQLEKLLKTSLYDDYIKLQHYMMDSSRKFLNASLLRYEVEDLKMLFRIVYTGRGDTAARDSLVFLKKYSSLDSKKLINSESVSDIITALKGSEYYKSLSYFLDISKQFHLFDIEMSLDLHFIMTILKLKDKLLSGADNESVTHSFGSEVDILNILMIYRCKKIFKFPPELTYKYVIPYWYRLSREQLVQLSKCKNVEEFKRLIIKTKYKNLFKIDEEHLWEKNSMDYMHSIYKSDLRRSSFNFGTVNAYLHLKEIDIKNIVTLIESVRYNLPRDEILSYLVL